ncbi:MAG: protoheme farnesyltransferase (Heme synthase) (HemeB farnesyltransferase) [Chloroflexi bacterium]|nr:protoheme farnesyltransferase (Heme synthase) (HemeB farnesyltransferase) [Chloroflexota bacterium]
MTRFQRLTAATVTTTFLLIAIGAVVRATGSGLSCPTWPGCFPGQFLPGLDADYHVWIEWIHRTVAVLIGLLILAMLAAAVRDHRDRPAIIRGSGLALALVIFQGWLGRETVRLGNSGESVTAHLASAMALFGLLIYLHLRSRYPVRITGPGGSQRFTLVAAFAAATMFALLLFGSNVTALNAALIFPDWPLMSGSLLPLASSRPADAAVLATAQALHRYVAVVVLAIVIALVLAARRLQPAQPRLAGMARTILVTYLAQVVIGGIQVLTGLAGWAQVLHVVFGTAIWGTSVALVVASFYGARLAAATSPGGAGGLGPAAAAEPRASARKSTIRAYIALTKPRIIELLLVTTVPAMVLATRDVPGIQPLDWLWIAFWTLFCGALAAGAANAINQYLDRDLDERMVRTRRRPLPAQDIAPERALIFGIVLAVVSVALMAWFVNLLAAFLTLLAIAFYVFVYTIMLKRSTPQNIVIGGAAGALPPVIGWAAITGTVGLPAIMLFLLVFYWTPPHFWALALRLRGDYASAGIPMLPVVRGVAETSRQIALYTVLLVAISLVVAVVAQMGLVYLVAALILGAIFLWHAYVLWRQGAAPEASTAQSIRLYRFSILYLTLLFAAVAVDVVVPLSFG